jgi:hypothetical protein
MNLSAVHKSIRSLKRLLPAYETGSPAAFGEQFHTGLDSLPAVFNHRREKRLFHSLDRYTSQKVSSSNEQTC